jgi:hypothetical protein
MNILCCFFLGRGKLGNLTFFYSQWENFNMKFCEILLNFTVCKWVRKSEIQILLEKIFGHKLSIIICFIPFHFFCHFSRLKRALHSCNFISWLIGNKFHTWKGSSEWKNERAELNTKNSSSKLPTFPLFTRRYKEKCAERPSERDENYSSKSFLYTFYHFLSLSLSRLTWWYIDAALFWWILSACIYCTLAQRARVCVCVDEMPSGKLHFRFVFNASNYKVSVNNANLFTSYFSRNSSSLSLSRKRRWCTLSGWF